MTRKNKKKFRLKRWIWFLFAICSGFCLLVTEVVILKWNDDNKKIEKQVEEIKKEVEVEMSETDASENVNPPDDKNSDYWNYMKMPLLSVDFKILKEKNSDTVAFIKVNGTNVNYPVVQADDNDYYLEHAFDKTKNKAGWVFLDYRNDIENLQDNTIIYAHGRLDTTMFGSLKNILKNKWYKDIDNRVVYLSTSQDNTMWQVFSVYVVPTETYYLTSSFGSEESKTNFINKITSRSVYDFSNDVNVNDKLLTLSTCYNDKEKLVLHAKLIKRQAR